MRRQSRRTPAETAGGEREVLALSDETSASGRPALAETRDVDWERFVKAVHSLPYKRRKWGLARAISWGRTQLRSLFGLLALDADAALTPEQAQALRGVRLYFTTGVLLVMVRSDRIGLQRRTQFLEAVEALYLEPTLRAVFRRTPAPLRPAYEPKTQEAPSE